MDMWRSLVTLPRPTEHLKAKADPWRASSAQNSHARCGWAQKSLARCGWAQNSLARCGWAQNSLARCGWASLGLAGEYGAESWLKTAVKERVGRRWELVLPEPAGRPNVAANVEDDRRIGS